MAVKFISIKCPECGAKLPMEEGRNTMFCSYCGKQVVLANNEYKYEVVHHHVDDAKIMRAETSRARMEAEWEYKLRRLEIRAQEAKRNRIGRYFAYGVALVILIVSMTDIFGRDEASALGIMGIIASVCIAVCTFSYGIIEYRRQRKYEEEDE